MALRVLMVSLVVSLPENPAGHKATTCIRCSDSSRCCCLGTGRVAKHRGGVRGVWLGEGCETGHKVYSPGRGGVWVCIGVYSWAQGVYSCA